MQNAITPCSCCQHIQLSHGATRHTRQNANKCKDDNTARRTYIAVHRNTHVHCTVHYLQMLVKLQNNNDSHTLTSTQLSHFLLCTATMYVTVNTHICTLSFSLQLLPVQLTVCSGIWICSYSSCKVKASMRAEIFCPRNAMLIPAPTHPTALSIKMLESLLGTRWITQLNQLSVLSNNVCSAAAHSVTVNVTVKQRPLQKQSPWIVDTLDPNTVGPQLLCPFWESHGVPVVSPWPI